MAEERNQREVTAKRKVEGEQGNDGERAVVAGKSKRSYGQGGKIWKTREELQSERRILSR